MRSTFNIFMGQTRVATALIQIAQRDAFKQIKQFEQEQTPRERMVVVRANYLKSIEEMAEMFGRVNTDWYPLFRNNSDLTTLLTTGFSSTRVEVGKVFKDKTAKESAERIRDIQIRNLKKYRNIYGPSVEFLSKGTNPELDKQAEEHLRELGVKEKEIKLEPVDNTKLKSYFQIIKGACRTGGEDLGLKDEEFIKLVRSEKESITELPVDVQILLAELKESIDEFSAQGPLLKEALKELIQSKEISDAVVNQVANGSSVLQANLFSPPEIALKEVLTAHGIGDKLKQNGMVQQSGEKDKQADNNGQEWGERVKSESSGNKKPMLDPSNQRG